MRSAERATRGVLARMDQVCNRLYGWQYNPLYQSGALSVALFLVTLATGIYLLLFYRIGAPYESVVRITQELPAGAWMRSVHRYASDALVVAVTVHALRMFAQGRSWGPRLLAWVSGWLLVALIFLVGWTGYVMVWDVQAQVLATETARLLAVLPIFSEPLGRAFTGEQPVPSAFFFLNLFLHILLPVGLAVLLWLHLSRVARPVLLPPRGLLWGVLAVLAVVGLVWPARMAPPADLFRLPGEAPYDVFYAFWIPLSKALPPWAVWVVVLLGAFVVLVLVPRGAAIHRAERPAPSAVDEEVCTGCEQCYLDCPFDAIGMVEGPPGRTHGVARVDPALCVSCGVCAGSCAPMVVGPPGRSGRDLLAMVRAGFRRDALESGTVVVAGCARTAAAALTDDTYGIAAIHLVACAGNLHTSVIEHLVRRYPGVLVASCPERDCWNREGALWLRHRLYLDREAELKARVDRRRIRLVHVASRDEARLTREVAAFHEELVARGLKDGPLVPDGMDTVQGRRAPTTKSGVEEGRSV